MYTAGLLAKFRGKHVRRSLILLLHAFSLAHARGGSQTRTYFFLVVYFYNKLSVPLVMDGHAAVDSIL